MPVHAETLYVSLRQSHPMCLDVELACAAGELLALVGPSGAGKSTVLRFIAGLTRAEHGEVRLGEEVWCDITKGTFVPPQHRRVGMVFQNYALMPHLTARRNVALAMDGDLDKAAGLLQRLGLSAEQIERRPDRLSGGQQQRVALARALAREPRVLLLDEPFSAVDQVTRQVLYREISELKQSMGVPIIMVTHDLDEARLLCDQMAVMDGGVLLQKGAPERIYQGPRNERVAELVGIQNRFTGVFESRLDDGHAVLRWGSHEHAARLRIPDKGRVEPGQTVNWVIPPDAIELLPVTAAPPHGHESGSGSPVLDTGQACWPARVLELRSLGEIRMCRLRLETPQPQEIVLNFSALNFPEIELRPESMLGLAFDPARIHVMPVRNHGGPPSDS